MYYAMSMYNLRSNWYILLLVVCWLLGYGGTPFTYPRVTINLFSYNVVFVRHVVC